MANRSPILTIATLFKGETLNTEALPLVNGGGEMARLYRQGDVLLQELKKLPAKLTMKDDTLAKGEVTGHRHRLIGQAQVYADAEGQQFAEVQNPAQLIHEEHRPIQVPAGVYRVRLQREFDLSQRIRQVSD